MCDFGCHGRARGAMRSDYAAYRTRKVAPVMVTVTVTVTVRVKVKVNAKVKVKVTVTVTVTVKVHRVLAGECGRQTGRCLAGGIQHMH